MEPQDFYKTMATAWRQYEDGLLTEQEWFYKAAAAYHELAPADPVWTASRPTA